LPCRLSSCCCCCCCCAVGGKDGGARSIRVCSGEWSMFFCRYSDSFVAKIFQVYMQFAYNLYIWKK
jgi:hypothetical protein